MGNELGQQKVGAGTAAANTTSSDTAGVGKTTQVDGAAPAGAATSGLMPPAPPEYAALDTDLVLKLWTSRTVLAGKKAEFKGVTDDKFWDAIRAIGAADLHTMSVVCKGAKTVGVWSNVQTITGWYTYDSSYAIEFLGNPVGITTNGQWGKDIPQGAVRAEHKNTKHEWYRNNSGSGNPGMHLGIDQGEGYNNIHWDPTNPMFTVGTGLLDKGLAIYSPIALISHAGEIGKFGDAAQDFLKKPNTPTEKFNKISSALISADKGLEYAADEENSKGKLDAARSTEIVGNIRAAAAAIHAIETTAKGLAQLDDAASQAPLDEQLVKLDAATLKLFTALSALVIYLHDETGMSMTPFSTLVEWQTKPTYLAYDTLHHLWDHRTATRGGN